MTLTELSQATVAVALELCATKVTELQTRLRSSQDDVNTLRMTIENGGLDLIIAQRVMQAYGENDQVQSLRQNLPYLDVSDASHLLYRARQLPKDNET